MALQGPLLILPIGAGYLEVDPFFSAYCQFADNFPDQCANPMREFGTLVTGLDIGTRGLRHAVRRDRMRAADTMEKAAATAEAWSGAPERRLKQRIAEDAFQEVWTMVFELRSKQKEVSRFQSLLFRTARNICVNSLRREWVRSRGKVEMRSSLASVQDSASEDEELRSLRKDDRL